MSRVCCSYRLTLQARLRSRIRMLEQVRRGYHQTHIVQQAASEQVNEAKSTTRSIYLDTFPPTSTQASAASFFFEQHNPRISWVANEWRKQSHSPSTPTTSQVHTSDSALPLLTPEIAFLGRSNTGKSSLLNALLRSPGLCRVGAKPGKTTTMHAWTLSAPTGSETTKTRTKTETLTGQNTNPNDRLTVLDMPGYGHGSRDEWGADIVKYLRRRRQLRRAMLLLNPKHGIKQGDEQILDFLRTNNIPHQIVACKCDALPAREFTHQLTQLRAEIKNNEQTRGSKMSGTTLCIDDMLVVGNLGDGKMNRTHDLSAAFGLDEVRWAILQATGLDEFALQQWIKLQEKQQQQRDTSDRSARRAVKRVVVKSQPHTVMTA